MRSIQDIAFAAEFAVRYLDGEARIKGSNGRYESARAALIAAGDRGDVEAVRSGIAAAADTLRACKACRKGLDAALRSIA